MNTPIPTPIKFFDTKTRIGRLRYFAYPIGLLLLVLPVFLIAGISFAANLKTLGVMLIALAYLFMIIMQIIFMIRRLHDMNTSGWWCLIYFSFIPFLILVGMHLLAGVLFFVYVVLMLANLVFVLILLFYPGTKDENRFGPPPPANSGWVIAGAWSYLSVFLSGFWRPSPFLNIKTTSLAHRWQRPLNFQMQRVIKCICISSRTNSGHRHLELSTLRQPVRPQLVVMLILSRVLFHQMVLTGSLPP